jgi:hypothetical protein
VKILKTWKSLSDEKKQEIKKEIIVDCCIVLPIKLIIIGLILIFVVFVAWRAGALVGMDIIIDLLPERVVVHYEACPIECGSCLETFTPFIK